jgi:hypothetical protein
MAGGYKKFGPTYNSTPFVRLGIEGDINGNFAISETLVNTAKANLPDAGTVESGEYEPAMALAGKIAAITSDGIGLANKGAGAVGLFREDLQDMVNASYKASFYFRGGEYYIAADRLATNAYDAIAVGDLLTTDASGCLKKLTDASTEKAVATAIYKGEYRNGNMYEWAGSNANGGNYLGIILHM